MTKAEWQASNKKRDPKFKGSIFEALGYQGRLCPNCQAHLRKGICLNACHLGDGDKISFAAEMQKAVKRGR